MEGTNLDSSENTAKRPSFLRSWHTWFHESSSSSGESGHQKQGLIYWMKTCISRLKGSKKDPSQEGDGRSGQKIIQPCKPSKRSWRESAGNDDDPLVAKTAENKRHLGQGDYCMQQQQTMAWHQQPQKPRNVPFHLPSCPNNHEQLSHALSTVSEVKPVPGLTDTRAWARGRVRFAPVAIGTDSEAALDAQSWVNHQSACLSSCQHEVPQEPVLKRRKLEHNPCVATDFKNSGRTVTQTKEKSMNANYESRWMSSAQGDHQHDYIQGNAQLCQKEVVQPMTENGKQQKIPTANFSGIPVRSIYGPKSPNIGIPLPFTTPRLSGFSRRQMQIGELMGSAGNSLFDSSFAADDGRLEAGEAMMKTSLHQNNLQGNTTLLSKVHSECDAAVVDDDDDDGSRHENTSFDVSTLDSHIENTSEKPWKKQGRIRCRSCWRKRFDRILQNRFKGGGNKFVKDSMSNDDDSWGFTAGSVVRASNHPDSDLTPTFCFRGGSGSAHTREDDPGVNKHRPPHHTLVESRSSLTGIAEPMQNWSAMRVASQENLLVNQYAHGADVLLSTVPHQVPPTGPIALDFDSNSNKPNNNHKLRTEGMVVTAALRLSRKQSIVNLMRGDCNEFCPAGEMSCTGGVEPRLKVGGNKAELVYEGKQQEKRHRCEHKSTKHAELESFEIQEALEEPEKEEEESTK